MSDQISRGKPEYPHSGLTGLIIGCAMKVHSKLGPGLLETTYHACLAYELENAGLEVQSQVALPLAYGDVRLEVDTEST